MILNNEHLCSDYTKVLPHKVINTLFTFSYDGKGKMIEDRKSRGKRIYIAIIEEVKNLN